MPVTLKWVGSQVTPECPCGWRGRTVSSPKEARAEYKTHARDDCPIGGR